MLITTWIVEQILGNAGIDLTMIFAVAWITKIVCEDCIAGIAQEDINGYLH